MLADVAVAVPQLRTLASEKALPRVRDIWGWFPLRWMRKREIATSAGNDE